MHFFSPLGWFTSGAADRMYPSLCHTGIPVESMIMGRQSDNKEKKRKKKKANGGRSGNCRVPLIQM